MRISITSIAHSQQRYDTCGDWQIDTDIDGDTEITIYVSETGNQKEAFLLAVHELIEAGLCYFSGITSQQVDNFDLNWAPHEGANEPGSDVAAPYFHQHWIAEHIEKRLADELCVNWKEYESHLNALEYPCE